MTCTPCVLFPVILLGAASVFAEPPVAPTRPVVDDYHGVKISDPYRYLENFGDPEVQGWVKAQAQYAEQTLKAIPGREELLARVRELDQGAPYRISIVRRWPNGDLHYLKVLAEENLEKLYFKDARTGREQLLIDPEKLGDPASGKHVSLQFVRPSPDGKYVAYGLAAAGSEQTTLHVLETATLRDLPERIDRMEADYTEPCWLPDSSGFVYSRRRKLAPDAAPTEAYKQTSAYLHRLGTDPESDPVIFARDHSPEVPISEADFPSLILTSGSPFVVGKIKHGDSKELTLYSAPLESLGRPQIPWKKVCGVQDEVSDFGMHGDVVDLVTASGAPRGKIVRTSLDQPDFASAPTVYTPGAGLVVESLQVARDGVYVQLQRAGAGAIYRLPNEPDVRGGFISQPGESSVYPVAANPDVDGVLVATSNWTRAGKIYAFDPRQETLTDTGLRPAGKFDALEGYESSEVEVTSHDGVKVPLSIVHKSGLKLDGSNPTLVSGYGAYGAVMSVNFSPVRIAWLERGGVLAFAHVRGGGELGKEWQHAGRQSTKPNTWKDFIACCEYLVKAKYTSPEKLAGQGGSAGGILIGRAITARPDLFSAALIGVGCTDTLRMETTANGVPNIQEFGTVANKAGFAALLEMSAYEHVQPGVRYPAVLLTHGINDPRVEPWMSAKMTARLQAATASSRPVLFRVDYAAGHGIGSTKTQSQELLADQWAFLLWQMNGSAATSRNE